MAEPAEPVPSGEVNVDPARLIAALPDLLVLCTAEGLINMARLDDPLDSSPSCLRCCFFPPCFVTSRFDGDDAHNAGRTAANRTTRRILRYRFWTYGERSLIIILWL